MKKSVTVITMMVLILVQLTGCKNGNSNVNNNDSGIQPTEEAYEEMFESQELLQQPSGQFGFGLMGDFDEEVRYEYNGEEIHIPYYVEGMDKKNNSDFGLMLFVNGVPQVFQLQYKDGTIEKEAIMHKFVLEKTERREFDLVFIPQSGKKGERISFIPIVIIKPDFVPESVSNPSFGNFLHLSANIPFEIKLNAEVKEQFSGEALLKEQDLTQEILDKAKKNVHGNTLDSYDTCPKLSIYSPEDMDDQVIYADGDKVKLGIQIYGGADVSQRITIFVNNKPVKINGKDYIKVKTEKGKMYQGDVELQLDDYEQLNSIYAVTMTDGEDYYVQDVFASHVGLLVER